MQCFCDNPAEAKYLARMGVDFMDADHPDVIKAAVRSIPVEEIGKPISIFEGK